MIRLFTYALSAALFCSNLLPAAAPANAQVVDQPQQESLISFNGPQNMNSDQLIGGVQTLNASVTRLADSLSKEELKETSKFFIERITFSVLSTLFFTAGLCFMYHSHQMRTSLPVPPLTRLQDIITLQAKYFLVNDILSKSMLFFLFGGWALKKVCEKPAKKRAIPAIPVVAPVAVPAQA